MATEKIFVQIDNDKIELTGQAKADFIADREALLETQRLLEAEYKAKQDSRESAIKKLAKIAGLTEQEIEAII
jgi:predicted nucleic-acid-binding protein